MIAMVRRSAARRSEGSARSGREGQSGAGGVELAVAFSSLLLALFFVVGAMRLSTTRSDVSAASRAAARAAAQTYTAAQAEREATVVAGDLLAERGVGCRGLRVEVSDDVRPGSIVTATVSCRVDLSDVALVGFPGSSNVEATAAELVDVVRGGAG